MSSTQSLDVLLISFTSITDVPACPPGKDIIKYLETYADKFDVNKYIKFSTKVAKVERDESRRKWLVTSVQADAEDGSNPPIETKEFDRIIIATGRQLKIVEPRSRYWQPTCSGKSGTESHSWQDRIGACCEAHHRPPISRTGRRSNA